MVPCFCCLFVLISGSLVFLLDLLSFVTISSAPHIIIQTEQTNEKWDLLVSHGKISENNLT